MKTITNRFGELQTSWESHKHPESENFMQVVKYTHIEHKDGRNNLHWRLANAAVNDIHVISDIKLNDALNRYADVDVHAITEEEFERWLKDTRHLGNV